jgi:prephenate dehydrogenase
MDSIKNVAIIGLGLLGGSLGLALKNTSYKRLAWARREETRKLALENDIVDEVYSDIEEVLQKADLTVLCLPIPQIINYLYKYADNFKEGSIVTDIGSVKEVIVDAGEDALAGRNVIFVGSHPMAGTEHSGLESALKGLYDNAIIFVTPTQDTSEVAADLVQQFWNDIDAKSVLISVKKHDELVAHTSHISHVIALALTLTVLDCDSQEDKANRFDGCSSGFRDTSRITSSNPKMWREIIENNQPAVLEVVKNVEKEWDDIRTVIENKEYDKLEALFAKGKKLRDEWLDYKYPSN